MADVRNEGSRVFKKSRRFFLICHFILFVSQAHKPHFCTKALNQLRKKDEVKVFGSVSAPMAQYQPLHVLVVSSVSLTSLNPHKGCVITGKKKKLHSTLKLSFNCCKLLFSLLQALGAKKKRQKNWKVNNPLNQ